MWLEIDISLYEPLVKVGSDIILTKSGFEGKVDVHVARVLSILDERKTAPFTIGKSQPKLFMPFEIKGIIKYFNLIEHTIKVMEKNSDIEQQNEGIRRISEYCKTLRDGINRLEEAIQKNQYNTSYGAINIEDGAIKTKEIE